MVTETNKALAIAQKDVTFSGEPSLPMSRELIKQIAMDIGKEVVAYIEVQYPEAMKAASSTFPLSVRNCIYNEIIESIRFNDQGKIVERLEQRRVARRKWKAQWKKIRDMKPRGTP